VVIYFVAQRVVSCMPETVRSAYRKSALVRSYGTRARRCVGTLLSAGSHCDTGESLVVLPSQRRLSLAAGR
jgi:hypothetical protein